MNSLEVPTTRSRSRSNTPFLRSLCDHENCREDHGEQNQHIHVKKIVKKFPTEKTITEETLNLDTTKSANSHDTIESTSYHTPSSVTTVTTEIKSTRVVSEGGESSFKLKEKKESNNLKKRQEKEIMKNILKEPHLITTSTNTQPSSTKTSEYIVASNNEHIAYRIYKAAGEYWNKYPKTDYTYSEKSPHRRELAPGFINMPNMSRRSLEKHDERVNIMISNNPTQAEYIRSRYESVQTKYQNHTQLNRNLDCLYDSQDEVDHSEYNGNSSNTLKSRLTNSNNSSIQYNNIEERTSILRQFFSAIVTIVIRVFSVFRNNKENMHDYTIYQSHQQTSVVPTMLSPLMSLFQRIYILISSVLILDSWMLQTKSQRNIRGFFIFLLLLFPLLLIAALLSSNENQKYLLFTGLTGSLSASEWFQHPNSWIEYYTSPNLYASSESSVNHKLEAAEYSDILRRIDLYIDRGIDAKLKEGYHLRSDNLNLNQEFKNFVKNIVNENLLNNNLRVSNKEIERITEIVRLQIKADSHVVPKALTNEMISEILKLIEQTFNAKSSSFVINYDEIIATLLESTAFKIKTKEDESAINLKIVNHENLIREVILKLSEIQDNLLKSDEKIMSNRMDMELGNAALTTDIGKLRQYMTDQITMLLQKFDEQMEVNTNTSNKFLQMNLKLKRDLANILGYTKTEDFNDNDFREWIQVTFTAKEYITNYLNDFKVSINQNITGELAKSTQEFITIINNRIQAEIVKLNNDGTGGAIDDVQIRKIVKDTLAIYDADKTGLVDYALESAGGQVVSTRCTETYHTKSAQISVFGIPLWYPANTPRIAISPSVAPGECWAFQGFPGFLVIKLNGDVIVTGFTMEHIPKSLAPSGKIDSAPQNFTVWGLHSESDDNAFLYGSYQYKENSTALQYFPVLNMSENKIPYNLVELRITSNHGNERYTCLYRFRVHGTSLHF